MNNTNQLGWNAGQPIMGQIQYGTQYANNTPPVQIAPPPRFQQQPMQQPAMSQPQPIPQMVISGKWVNDLSDISPGDVPMDRGVHIFPKSDYSCIYAKIWDQNGVLQTYKFVPEAPSESNAVTASAPSDEKMDRILDSLDKIYDKVIHLPNGYKKPYRPNKNKSEIRKENKS